MSASWSIPAQEQLLRNEVLLLLSCECREEVDSLVAKAIAAGGSTCDQPEDVGFMYTRSFVDPDGHGGGGCSI